jgi:hypothetical protein
LPNADATLFITCPSAAPGAEISSDPIAAPPMTMNSPGWKSTWNGPPT